MHTQDCTNEYPVYVYVAVQKLNADRPCFYNSGFAFPMLNLQVAMGVPLINAIYESDPLVGLYTLPLLIWHPMQLVVGSFLAPRLSEFVEQEKERLGIKQVGTDEELGASAKEQGSAELGAIVTDDSPVSSTGEREA